MLKEKTKLAILELQKQYPEKRSAIIPALHLAQKEQGYLPQETQAEVAELFEISQNEVNSLVTFYDMFYEKPVGKHIIHACKNLSCMLKGSDKMIQQLCQKLQINPNETTADKEITVILSECLAACDRAPMILANDKVIGPVKDSDLDEIITSLKKTSGHVCSVPSFEVSHE